MSLRPCEIAKESEHSHQAAFFCFVNAAKFHGFNYAIEWSYNKNFELPKIEINNPKYPELDFVFAIPNGASRGDSVKSRQIRGSMLKAEGVKSGVADVFFPKQFYFNGKMLSCGLFIEFKKLSERGIKSAQGAKQKDFEKYCITNNYTYRICYTWEEAAKLIVSYTMQIDSNFLVQRL
jgi:hypothetical protein